MSRHANIPVGSNCPGKNKSLPVLPTSASAVVFDFRLGREREGPKRFLEDFAGILQSDG
jgi:hypothetical protein